MRNALSNWGIPGTNVVREASRMAFDDCDEATHVPTFDAALRRARYSRRISLFLADLMEPAPGTRCWVPNDGWQELRAVLEAAGARIQENGPVERVLWAEPHPVPTVGVAAGGFTLHLDLRPGQEKLEKVLGENEGPRIGLRGLKIGPQNPDGKRHTVLQLLELEGLEHRALMATPQSRMDVQFGHAVADTWNPPSHWDPALPEPQRQRLHEAFRFFHVGYIEQFAGELDEAIACYERSLSFFPTAEAHTFLGWAHHFARRIDKAIEECRRAIEVDPDFGNPYNDIGAYLLELGKPREALPWFERAKEASRYHSPHYAYCNAGRAYMMMGRPSEARQELEAALRISPGYPPAVEYLRRLSGDAG